MNRCLGCRFYKDDGIPYPDGFGECPECKRPIKPENIDKIFDDVEDCAVKESK